MALSTILKRLVVYKSQNHLVAVQVVEQEGGSHGGFKNSNNSLTYDILYELSKLTSYKHGDQRNGKADE